MSRANLLRFGVLACIWGASFLFIKIALEGLSPLQIVLGRLLAGAGVLLAIVVIRRQPLPLAPAMLGHLALMAVVANVVPFFLFAWGEERVTSGMAGVLNGTTPLFTLAVAVLALEEERLTRHRIGGLLVGFLGVVLVVAPWTSDGGSNTVSGQLACLGAAACYGLSFPYTRRFIANRGYPPLALSAVQLSLATAMLVVIVPIFAGTPMTLTVPVVASVLTLGALGTGLAYLLYYRLIAEAGATNASLVTYLIPVVAVALGVAVQGDPLTWNLFVGAAVVITGAALAEGRLTRPTVEAPVAPASGERVGS